MLPRHGHSSPRAPLRLVSLSLLLACGGAAAPPPPHTPPVPPPAVEPVPQSACAHLASAKDAAWAADLPTPHRGHLYGGVLPQGVVHTVTVEAGQGDQVNYVVVGLELEADVLYELSYFLPRDATLLLLGVPKDALRMRGAGPDAVSLQPRETGCYRLAVGSGLYSEPTSLSLRSLGRDDHGGDLDSATALGPLPAVAQGHLAGDIDVDLFSFPVVAGHTYAITCEPQGSEHTVTALDPGGSPLWLPLAYSHALAAGTLMTKAAFRAQVSGRHYLRLAMQFAWVTGAYRCEVHDAGVDDLSSLVEAPTPASVPLQSTFRFEHVGDIDALAIPLVQGRALRAVCTREDGGRCGLCLFDGPRASTTLECGESAAGRQVQVLPRQTGPHLLQVLGDSAGAYTRTLEDLGPDEHGDTPESATPLPLGTRVSGLSHAYADLDVFSFAGESAGVYRLTCEGLVSSPCRMTLPASFLQAPPADVPPGSSIRYVQFVDAALLPVTVEAAREGYTLRVERVGTADDPYRTPRRLTLGTEVEDVLTWSWESDPFSVDLRDLTRRRVVAAATSGVPLFVNVMGPDGEVRLEADGGFTPPRTGRYTLRVNGLLEPAPDGAGPYRLRIE